MATHIKLDDVCFCRETRSILNGVNFDIEQGKITAIMGPSGIGKTTLLRLIAGNLQANSGEVYIQNEKISEFSYGKLQDYRKSLGFLFQSSALFTGMSVFDNIAFPLREHTNLPEELIKNIVLMKLELVGLRGTVDLYPEELSGGMARRVALARALALDPNIMLYDEPFTGQDPISVGILLRLIKDINKLFGITSVIVSHDVEEIMQIADYIYIIAGGQVIDYGSTDDIKNSSNSATRQFINGIPDGEVPFHYKAKNYYEDLLDA